ncbi:MAG: DUF5926 family protein [Nocardioidaceae bacterium]
MKARQEPLPEGEVGPRQPCPCGSGRRYRSCHGGPHPGQVYVARPFAGLTGEADIVAMREIVAAATAPVRLREDAFDGAASGREVLLCSLLPTAAPALARQDGTIWLGLQVQHAFGDPSRDLAAVLEGALHAEPGTVVGLTDPPGAGPRLQDLLLDVPLEVSVHDGFDYWIADVEDPDGAMHASLESANAAARPTARLAGVQAAYWTEAGAREFLRWVMTDAEGPLLDALARLHSAGADALVEGSRLVGMFRAHGLLVPVWDLPPGTGAAVLEEPAARFAADLRQALATAGPLNAEERAARNGLTNRQMTIR